MNQRGEQEPTVEEMGENLAELLRLNREEVDALTRLGDRFDDLQRRLETNPFPFLPPPRPPKRPGDAR